MKWIIAPTGQKVVSLDKVDMVYIESNEEKELSERYSVLARNKEFRAYLCFDESIEECIKVMDCFIEQLHDDWDDDIIDLRPGHYEEVEEASSECPAISDDIDKDF